MRVAEVFAALGWSARAAGRAIRVVARAVAWAAVAGARALGRMVLAMFPEKEEAPEAQDYPAVEERAAWRQCLCSEFKPAYRYRDGCERRFYPAIGASWQANPGDLVHGV